MDLDLYSLYKLSELNSSNIKVLYASPELFTDFGKGCKIGDYIKTISDEKLFDKAELVLLEDALKDYLANTVVFSDTIFKENIRFVYFGEIAYKSIVMRGLKSLTCENIDDLIKGVGLDVFALYVNRSNLYYIGYHNAEDRTISKGCIRELKSTYSGVSDLDLCDKWCTATDKAAIMSKFTTTMVPYIQLKNG